MTLMLYLKAIVIFALHCHDYKLNSSQEALQCTLLTEECVMMMAFLDQRTLEALDYNADY